MVRIKPPTGRSTSSLVVVKQPRATYNSDQTQGKLTKSTLKLHNLCVGWSTQSLSLGKTIGYTQLTLGPTHWSSTPLWMAHSCLRPSSMGEAA
jgi:hypothetical protein